VQGLVNAEWKFKNYYSPAPVVSSPFNPPHRRLCADCGYACPVGNSSRKLLFVVNFIRGTFSFLKQEEWSESEKESTKSHKKQTGRKIEKR